MSTSKTIYKYDANGATTEEQSYNSTGDLSERKIFKSDVNKNPTKITTYSVAKKFGGIMNELESITEYSYKY